MLDRILEFLDPYLAAPYGYMVVGLATFLENSVGAGFIVPGETLVIVGGFYARTGELQPWLVATVAVVGAILGDNLGTGWAAGTAVGLLRAARPQGAVTPERLIAAERYYGAHGGKTVFLGRFVPVVRSVGFIVAGIAHSAVAALPRLRRGRGADLGDRALRARVRPRGLVRARWERYATPIGLGFLVVLLFPIGSNT